MKKQAIKNQSIASTTHRSVRMARSKLGLCVLTAYTTPTLLTLSQAQASGDCEAEENTGDDI